MMQSKNNCFIDFDGTIICNRKRLYQFFVDNIDEKYKQSLNEEEFWALKRLGINEIEWVNKQYKVDLCYKGWGERKKQLIENNEYLKYNNLFDFSIEALEKLSRKYNLILITRRSNKKNVLSEIESFNITKYFNKILVVPHNGGTKAAFIRANNIKVSNDDIFIGDTEDDIEAALDLGIIPFFVMSGIRSQWIIRKLFSNRNINIVESINELV